LELVADIFARYLNFGSERQRLLAIIPRPCLRSNAQKGDREAREIIELARRELAELDRRYVKGKAA